MKWDKMLTGKSEYIELFFVHFFFFFSVLAAFCKLFIYFAKKNIYLFCKLYYLLF